MSLTMYYPNGTCIHKYSQSGGIDGEFKEYTAAQCQQRNQADTGYAQGVPTSGKVLILFRSNMPGHQKRGCRGGNGQGAGQEKVTQCFFDMIHGTAAYYASCRN
jgi:hypothetical protein